MNHSTKNNLFKTIFFAACGLAALIVSVGLFSQFNQIDVGQEPQIIKKALFLAAPLLLTLVFFMSAFFSSKKQEATRKTIEMLRQYRRLAAILLLFLSILVIYACSRYCDLNDPLVNHGMKGLGLLFFVLLLLFLAYSIINNYFLNRDKSRGFLAVILCVIAIAWVLMTVTRIGLEPDQAFWNVASVPMMWISLAGIILLVLICDAIFSWLIKKTTWKPDPKFLVLLEIMLVLLLWIGASLLWIKTPFSNSYFLLGPLPPDGYFLPKSDARLMDLGGQYLIIGGKLETPYYTEKPYYGLFLGLLHFLFGQSYQTISKIQILVLALFPIFLYFLGKQFSGKFFGFSLALYAVIKEATAILFTYKISVSNSRLFMTELPTAFLLALLALILFLWLRKQQGGFTLPLLAGSVIGIACFVRSNSLVVFVLLTGFIFLISLKNLRQRLPQLAVFLLGAAMVILPWTIYNRVTYGRDPITWKIQAALETRFVASKREVIKSTPAPKPTTAQAPTQLPPSDQTPNPVTPQPKPQAAKQRFAADYSSKVSKILGHFLNNQVKSLFVLPFQLYPARPTTILSQEYWQEPVTWNGKMPKEHLAAFVANLLLISLGLTFAWQQFRWAGLVPLVIQMSYYFSNALVRTSGSRYLLPVDWVVYFYFLLGVWVLLRSLKLLPSFKPGDLHETHHNPPQFWVSLCLILLVGLSLPLLNLAFPSKYSNETKAEVYNRLPMEKIENEIGISPADMERFYQKPNTLFLYGREIYPAYLPGDEGPVDKGLRFTLLTPDLYEIVIPYGIDLDKKLPEGEDMIVLGCKLPVSDQVIAYLGYFVQSDRLIWSTSTTFNGICP